MDAARWARLVDAATARGDIAAIAILEGPVYGYADRFIREGSSQERDRASGTDHDRARLVAMKKETH